MRQVENLEGKFYSLIKIVGRKIPSNGRMLTIFGAGMGILYCLLINLQIERSHIKNNLAPAAVYVEQTSLEVAVKNIDVNNDGKYESILEFRNPMTDSIETRLIERNGNRILFRDYQVIDGKIRYLQE